MSAKSLTVGVTVGLVLGTLAGILFAPASGAEVRRRLRYEWDYALATARSRVRRTTAYRQRVQPETADEEEAVAFSGA